ncbi:MAG: type II secretion system F family protein [Candidatus Solibacter usitatus]|nr:type II secretion system F family protein [Candidatus Solibacter usitatus]
MAEFLLKYADARGQIKEQVAEADSEADLRDRFQQQGFLIYSVKSTSRSLVPAIVRGSGRKRVNLEKFLIFNQQFLTLVRAGLPILKCLDLLADRLTDPKLSKHIQVVRDEVRNGALLSDAFSAAGVFPPIYVTSIMAGEKSGALIEVLERYLAYQRMTLAVRKKLVLALIYPCVLLVLVFGLIIFMITYVVPQFATLYSGLGSNLPAITTFLIAFGTGARDYILLIAAVLVGTVVGVRLWAGSESGKETLDQWKLRTPVLGVIWVKYQVAQLGRVLSTLLLGGIPLMQALETAFTSLDSRLLRRSLEQARQLVKEGQPLSKSLDQNKIFPALAIDMIEVGESTGALPAMLNSVAEFYEDDVTTQMTAALSLIEPAIMIFMGGFVAFVLISLYLPIFSLSDSFGGH